MTLLSKIISSGTQFSKLIIFWLLFVAFLFILRLLLSWVSVLIYLSFLFLIIFLNKISLDKVNGFIDLILVKLFLFSFFFILLLLLPLWVLYFFNDLGLDKGFRCDADIFFSYY